MTQTNKACLALFFSLLISSGLFAQTNAYQFLKPTISFSYDSSVFQFERPLQSNRKLNRYFFKLKGDERKGKIEITTAGKADVYPSQNIEDSMLLTGVTMFKNMDNDSFSTVSYDTAVRHINGFSCVGIVGTDKIEKRNVTIITCVHIAANDYTIIQFGRFYGDNLDSDYVIMNTFLAGFKSYSIIDMDKEDSEIVKKSVFVDSVVITLKNIDSFPRQNTYIGFVKTKEKSAYKIKEVRMKINDGTMTIPARPDGKMMLFFNDRTYGEIRKKANLILLDSFGREVSIPFSFSYFNEHPKPDHTIETINGVNYVWLRGEKHQLIKTGNK